MTLNNFSHVAVPLISLTCFTRWFFKVSSHLGFFSLLGAGVDLFTPWPFFWMKSPFLSFRISSPVQLADIYFFEFEMLARREEKFFQPQSFVILSPALAHLPSG